MPRTTGTYVMTAVAGEAVAAFLPFPLPPEAPPLSLDDTARGQLQAAETALDRLDVAIDLLPSIEWLVHAFVRKEAVLSSQIEGTQATLLDLLEHEAADDATDGDPDVQDVSSYLDALAGARAELARDRGLPLSLRLLDRTHARLMRNARGADKRPGEVRRSQSWIGGSRPSRAAFVPPPPRALPVLLSALEQYIHADDDLPPLVRAGLLHVQFETIHPYLDGNGRIGRLLVTLLLEHWRLLSAPVLYLSLHFKRHREEYYRRLGAVRTDGDWEGWIRYFLDGVATIGDEAVASARELSSLIAADRPRVLGGRSTSVMAARLFELLPRHPILTVTRAVDLLTTTRPTASKAITSLVDAGVLAETSGRKRDRTFAYAGYLDLLRAGTEL